MRSLIKAVYHKNGGQIKHMPNRAVSVHKVQLPESDSTSVLIQFKRADIKDEDKGKASTQTHFRCGAEFTGISLSQEAALVLMILLDNYFKKVDPEFINQFIEKKK